MAQFSCSKCQIKQPPDNFYPKRSQCKTCRAAIMKANRDRTGQKKCPQCTHFAPEAEFHGRICTKCINRVKRLERAEEAKFKRMDKREDAKVTRYELKTKKCIKCFQTKPKADFHKDNQTPDDYSYACSACTKAEKSIKRSALSETAAYTAYEYIHGHKHRDYIIATSMEDYARIRRHLTKHPQTRVELSAYIKAPGCDVFTLHAATGPELDVKVQRYLSYTQSLINTGIT